MVGYGRRGSVLRDGEALKESLYLEGVGDEGFQEHGGAAVEAGEGVELVEASHQGCPPGCSLAGGR